MRAEMVGAQVVDQDENHVGWRWASWQPVKGGIRTSTRAVASSSSALFRLPGAAMRSSCLSESRQRELDVPVREWGSALSTSRRVARRAADFSSCSVP